jgi:hypothetical protein
MRLAFSFGLGVLSSVAAYYLIQLWSGWPSWGRWAAALAIGLVILLVSHLMSRQRKSDQKDVVVSDLSGKESVRVSDIDVATDGSRPTKVASDIKSLREIVIRHVKVRRSHGRQDDKETHH